MTPKGEALRVRGLVKRYRRGLLGRSDRAPAVDTVDLSVDRGEVVALVGESGSGKTTLARCALGLLPFDAGRVEVLGRSLAGLSGRRLDRFRRRVQPLFQDPDAHLNPGLPVRRILLETVRVHRRGEAETPLVDEALAQVGLTGRAEALPHELSGGERRRVGIARLLLCRPELVVADEPTAGLDAARKAALMELLLVVGGPRRGLLVISHDLPLMAAIADRVLVMVSGRVVERFPASLLAGPHHPYTDELLAAAGLKDRVGALHPRPEPPPGGGRARQVGCPLATRCQLATPPCHTHRPTEVHLGPGQAVACHAAATLGSSAPSAPPAPGASTTPTSSSSS